MKSRLSTRRTLAAAFVATALVSGLGATPVEASPGIWQNDYYEDYFHSKGTCVNRGNWIVGAPPYAQEGIPGVDNYRCLKHVNDIKWSMNIHWIVGWDAVKK